MLLISFLTLIVILYAKMDVQRINTQADFVSISFRFVFCTHVSIALYRVESWALLACDHLMCVILNSCSDGWRINIFDFIWTCMSNGTSSICMQTKPYTKQTHSAVREMLNWAFQGNFIFYCCLKTHISAHENGASGLAGLATAKRCIDSSCSFSISQTILCFYVHL